MDVDAYRLAYNVLHHTWKKFGIPEEDIPPAKTEKVESLNAIIPGFSTSVVLFQIASRKNLKTFLDEECPTVHNLEDVCTRFIHIIKEIMTNNTDGEDLPKSEDNVSPDVAVKDSPKSKDMVFQETIEEYLSDSSLEAVKNVFLGIKREYLPEDNVKKSFLEDSMKEFLQENDFYSELIPCLMVYSLGVCTELVLYERENENNKEYMKHMPEMWKAFFDECLKPICNKAHYKEDHLKDYSNSIDVPEEFLNEFISENKNEYEYIASKFFDYTEKNSAKKSPEHSQLKTKVRSLSIGMSLLKLKEKFAAIKKICKCYVEGAKDDEMQLLSHHSTSSDSTPTSP